MKTMDAKLYQRLEQRIGPDHLRKRVGRQVELAAKFYARGGYASFHLENVELLPVILKFLLKMLLLYKRGLQNALDYRVEHMQVAIENLPKAFHGFRLLQLSDIHADGIADGGQKLIAILEQIKTDLCVLTGDFRFLTQDDYGPALRQTAALVGAIHAPHGVFGILGNHDFIEFVPALEGAGVNMLLNEAVPIRKDGAEIWLAGIDDAHLYDCHDLAKTLATAPGRSTKILLSHTPETYAEAAAAGIDYILCGHTHGGQICLPGGFPLITNARCPRRFCAGPWHFNGMHGYTSKATGASCLPVRFFCPPEVTIHELLCEG
ncbi:MAG: metallophosphoesterase [Deltaproteobacteria bacterium]|nr:metallophosphoesterase [Deltaproteobacteria bacterium]